MSLNDDFTAALNEPAATTRTGLTTGLSPQTRLVMAMRRANDADPTDVPDNTGERWSYSSLGVPNPYGSGIHAFEPNNVIFDAYREAEGAVANSKAEEDAAKDATLEMPAIPGADVTGPSFAADGQVKTMIDAAMQLAQRRVPYVWGGTTANGVDCSGLIYYAARAAGITLDGKAWPRLRAVDYGRLGTAVSLADARPGDIAYYDEPGGTDHVGIYIGNGKMIQAPTTGDVVKISNVGHATSIRRVFEDGAFGRIATAAGGSAVSYGGSVYDPAVGQYNPGIPLPGLQSALGSTITRPTGSGRSRAV